MDSVQAAVIDSFANGSPPLTLAPDQVLVEYIENRTVLVTILQTEGGPTASDITAAAENPVFLTNVAADLNVDEVFFELPPTTTEVIVAPPPPSPPPIPPLPPSPGGTGIQDTHLTFVHGGSCDFRGANNTWSTYLAAPGIVMNVKTSEATYFLKHKNLIVNGTFATAAAIALRVSDRKRKWFNFTIDASLFNKKLWSWRHVKGTCGGGNFVIGPRSRKTCEGTTVSTELSSASVEYRGWKLIVRTNHIYDHINGSENRIDVSIYSDKTAMGPAHGILGHAFHASVPFVMGKKDVYPESGFFKTSAQCEGGVPGDALGDYAVPSQLQNPTRVLENASLYETQKYAFLVSHPLPLNAENSFSSAE